jgi:hypothetical protein
MQNKTWEEINEEYSKDEYPAFGGPFTHAMTFIEWLKLNYEVPMEKNKTVQKEIEDKDISLEAYCQFGHNDLSRSLFIQGAKWYREQLKK